MGLNLSRSSDDERRKPSRFHRLRTIPACHTAHTNVVSQMAKIPPTSAFLTRNTTVSWFCTTPHTAAASSYTPNNVDKTSLVVLSIMNTTGQLESPQQKLLSSAGRFRLLRQYSEDAGWEGLTRASRKYSAQVQTRRVIKGPRPRVHYSSSVGGIRASVFLALSACTSPRANVALPTMAGRSRNTKTFLRESVTKAQRLLSGIAKSQSG